MKFPELNVQVKERGGKKPVKSYIQFILVFKKTCTCEYLCVCVSVRVCVCHGMLGCRWEREREEWGLLKCPKKSIENKRKDSSLKKTEGRCPGMYGGQWLDWTNWVSTRDGHFRGRTSYISWK